jgi:hypothetical protein
MRILILALVSLAAQHGFASTTDTWVGPGSTFDLKGAQVSTYELIVENIKTGNQTQSTITINLPTGKTEKLTCSSTDLGKEGWKSACAQTKGGGNCFGEGLCISYEEDAAGTAFATTIVMDGPSDMRLLRTELHHGMAVRFFREKLHKK